MNIYILTVSNEEDSSIFPFTTIEKAGEFVQNNFQYDKPRKVSKDLFEGVNNLYVIHQQVVDQIRI